MGEVAPTSNSALSKGPQPSALAVDTPAHHDEAPPANATGQNGTEDEVQHGRTVFSPLSLSISPTPMSAVCKEKVEDRGEPLAHYAHI